ncbi:MAG: YybH family protein [Candidatus Binatia bacterium]
MRRLLCILTLSFAVATAAFAAEKKAAATKPMDLLATHAIDEGLVNKLYAKFTEAWNSHDTKGMAAMWAPDGDHVEPDGTTARGREGVEKLFAREHQTVFKDSELELKLKSVWVITQDVALADGVYKVTGAKDQKGNAIPPREGRLTSVLLYEDGQWWVSASRLMIPVPLVWREK